jgi:hypothetical protein
MRISQDKDSWRAGGILRRDFRHTHGEPEVPQYKGKPKNGKRWCRGKVGREHQPMWTEWDRWNFRHEVCAACGKRLTYQWRRV